MRFTLASLLCFVMVAASCSADPGPDDFVESLVETRPDLAEGDARCVVTELQTSYADDELADLINSENELSDAELSLFSQRQFDAVRTCGLEDQISPALAESFAAANGLDSEVATCAVRALQERIGLWELTEQVAAGEDGIRFQRRQFEAIFECGDRTAVAEQLRPQLVDQGVREGDADCVATEVAETMSTSDLTVLYTGEMNDDFFRLYFMALEACDALPDDS